MTLINLGIAVDTSQAKTAATDLDKLAASAKGAEKASNDLASAGGKSGSGIAAVATSAKNATTELEASAVASTKAANAHAGLSTQAMAAQHSMRSMIEMLAMGVPPTQVLTAQMNHLSYAATGPGGLKGAFGEVFGMLGGMLTPMRLLGAGAIGAGAGALYLANSWSESGAQVKRSLIGIGAATGATVADINRFVATNSSATGLSVGEARDAAIEFTKTGAIAVQGLKGVGDAIHGYAILTGQDATSATKALAEALSGDLVQGALKIDKTYGAMNSATLDYIKTLELQGDRSKAIQVIIDSIAPDNLKAAGSVGVLSKAYQGLAGVLSSLKNGPIGETTSPSDQLAALRTQRNAAAQSGTTVGRNANGEMIQFASNAALLADFDKRIDETQKEFDKVNTAGVTAQLNQMSKAGDGVVKSLIPQIDQIDTLKKSLELLRAAQNTPGVSRPADNHDDAASRAIIVNTRMLEDQMDATDRINAKTLEIAGNYKDYSIEVARTLDVQKGQLSIAQAVTGQERLAAQEAEQRHRLDADSGIAPDKGGGAIAAGARAQAEAQIKSQIQGQLLAMQDQLAVAQAVTGQQQLTAQADATRNGILREIGDSNLANAAADMQRSIAEAQINSQIQAQITGLDQQTQLIYATAQGAGAAASAAIAYENAIRAGADATQAAALASATLAANTAKASVAADAASKAMHYAEGGPQEFGNQMGNQQYGMPGAQGTDAQQAMWNAAYGPGGFNSFIITGGNSLGPGARFDVVGRPNDQGLQYQYTNALNNAAMSQMDPVTRAKFKAGSYQISQAQAEAIANAYLTRMHLEDSPNAQKAAADFISRSDSSSGGSGTNNSLINPMYTSGSSSVIGFRAATGIDFTVPGSGPTDSVRVSGLVTPGERMIVVPPGGQAPGEAIANRVKSAINQRIVIQAASMRGASDTMPQLMARLARVAAVAARHR